MRKIKIILWVITSLIGLITAASLNGWRLDDYTIPKNRTREQYDFEGTFEPMFKFLEQEKKDFTGLKGYISHVYIEQGDEVKKYSVDLDITQADIKGDYTITIGDKEETVPVTYSNGKLTYSSEISPLFDEEILNLVVQRNYFESLDVKETFKSAETELSDIIYQPENHSELFKHLKNKYDLPEDTTCRIRLDHSSGTIYGVSILMESKDKAVQIDLTIFKE
ncbi:hypothetical protein HMPREF9381_0732 [Streptococcus sanguinis SK72]|uniref:Lipoprotein n=1 Tax=Streptococcus sanguinis SK72 TaxID=888809 RepID=F0I0P2_STRSA|nr:hypothetical protein [Streptococcus sanguinis]EGD29853.1 hypothetical protein HMPREF9381_0732 [Streptococcus sanguinis SK72]